MALAISLVSCEPSLEDTFEEIGTPTEEFGIAENDYIIVEEDYETLFDSDGDGIFQEYFDTKEEAENLIPDILEDLYPNLDIKSLANVTFNQKNDVFPITFNTTTDDYEDVFGTGTISISGIGQIGELLTFNYPQVDAGTYYEISYSDLGVNIAYTLTEEDYDLVGNGTFNNFDIREGSDEETIEVRVEKIATILEENFENTALGQRYDVTYAFWNGFAGTDTITLEYIGGNDVTYILVESAIPMYTLSNSDYDLIVSNLETTYPDAAGSMDSFGNFERRSDDDAFWDETMIEEAITIVLNNGFPTAIAGDKYQVTFDVYTGSSGTETYFFEKDSDSNYFISEGEINLVTKTEVVAYDGSDWVYPITFNEEEYTFMGQNFPNFSDEEEALKNIGIYLGTQYLFASEGDTLTVIYDFFNGSVRQVYTIFEFDGFNWVGKPIVYETSIQFGKEETGWEPDNTIVYTLISPTDYDFIGESLLTTTGFEDAADNLAFFHSFERRDTDNEYWSDEMMLTGLGVLLDDSVNPDAEIGQKYTITVTVWIGSLSTQIFNIIKEDGENGVGWYYQ